MVNSMCRGRIIIVRKKLLDNIKHMGKWIVIHGRRKTGKSFFVKNFLNWDMYFFVTYDGSIIYEEKHLTFNEFFTLFKTLVNEKNIVIDEFHRLPKIFFDYLRSISPKPTKKKLILISSTNWLARNMLFEDKSPVLGLFDAVHIPLIDEEDMLQGMKSVKDWKERVEASVYLREPILIPRYKPPLRECISNFLVNNKMFIEGLVNEVFREEERHFTEIYSSILHAVADGKITSSEITSYVFSHGLIQKDNPSLLSKYLEALVKIGLLEKIKTFDKRRFIYQHNSPLLDLYFYLDTKYGFSERDLPRKEVKKIIDARINYHVERFFRNLLAKKFGAPFVRIEKPEIDIALVSFKKIILVGEVKWGKISQKDVEKVEEKFSSFQNVEKLLIALDKNKLRSNEVKILTPSEVLKYKAMKN